MKNYLTINEVATRLGVSYPRVQQIIKEGGLSVIRVGRTGRFVRIEERELARYEKSRKEWASA